MIWVLLITGLLLVAAGSFTAGVCTSPWVLERLMPAQGGHAAPAPRTEPAPVPQPRHAGTPQTALLAIEPPPSIRADLPVKPARTTGPQPWHTAPFAAVPDEPTDAQTHGLYFGGDWGTRPQLAVEAEAGAQMAEVYLP